MRSAAGGLDLQVLGGRAATGTTVVVGNRVHLRVRRWSTLDGSTPAVEVRHDLGDGASANEVHLGPLTAFAAVSGLPTDGIPVDAFEP